MMKIFTIVLGFLVILTFMATLSNGFQSLEFSVLVNMNWATSTAFYRNPIAQYIGTIHQTKVYAIIFDAGSTGTRIHVYKFRYSQNESFPYVLVDELFEEVKPGLSSYANNPKNLRSGLVYLLQLAKRKIPKALWNHTWMTLKATAGLRLLLEDQAQQILSEATSVLTESGFRLMPDGVSIMTGLDEGILSWVTVNFLLQLVRQPQKSFGTMDLGGGSMQITFIPSQEVTFQLSPKEFIHIMRYAQSNEKIYSHSYLGLGLMSARYSLLTADRAAESSNISSSCVPHGYRGHWKFGGARYTIHSSASANVSMFDQCYRLSSLLITQKIPIHSPPELRNRQFYVFSYFYDRLKDAGHIVDISQTSHITPFQYASLAKIVCSPGYKNAYRKPFLCLDLAYIYALLKNGFQFQDSTTLYLAKNINNIELGWSLGAVFDLLHQTEKV